MTELERKEKKRVLGRVYYIANRERIREARKAYYYANKERCFARQAQWASENKEHVLQRAKENHAIRRAKALAVLGGKCITCGYCEDARALQIDHINGGGLHERRTKGPTYMIQQILLGNTKPYQLLCANCNAIKRIENKEHLRRCA